MRYVSMRYVRIITSLAQSVTAYRALDQWLSAVCCPGWTIPPVLSSRLDAGVTPPSRKHSLTYSPFQIFLPQFPKWFIRARMQSLQAMEAERQPDSRTMTADEARAAVEAEKDHRRQMRERALADVIARNPNGKLARRATPLWLDTQIRDDFIAEKGGDEGATQWVCWRVSGGETLEDIAGERCLDFGCLYEWVSRDAERLERYHRAQRGAADRMYGQIVPLADEATPDDIAVRKWQGQARALVAGKLDRERFGERDSGMVIELRDRKRPEELQAELRALVAANPGLRARVEGVMDVEVVPEILKPDAAASETKEQSHG